MVVRLASAVDCRYCCHIPGGDPVREDVRNAISRHVADLSLNLLLVETTIRSVKRDVLDLEDQPTPTILDDYRDLEIDLEGLEDALATLQHEIDAYSPILSPVRAMPFEIIAHIIELVLGRPRFLSERRRNALTDLRRICKRWNIVACGSSSLWRGVEIELCGEQMMRVDRIRQWLDRAGEGVTSRIQIKELYYGSYNSTRPSLYLSTCQATTSLLQTGRRWQEVALHACDNTIYKFDPAFTPSGEGLSSSWETVEELSLDFSVFDPESWMNDYSAKSCMWEEVLKGMTRLRALRIAGRNVLQTHPLALLCHATLQCLTLTGVKACPMTFARIFSFDSLPLLQEIRVSNLQAPSMVSEDVSDGNTLPDFQNPSVKTVVTGARLELWPFARIDFPLLQALKLDIRSVQDQGPRSLDFVKRSSHSLRHLWLVSSIRHSNTCNAFLNLVPFIQTLRIYETGCFSSFTSREGPLEHLETIFLNPEPSTDPFFHVALIRDTIVPTIVNFVEGRKLDRRPPLQLRVVLMGKQNYWDLAAFKPLTVAGIVVEMDHEKVDATPWAPCTEFWEEEADYSLAQEQSDSDLDEDYAGWGEEADRYSWYDDNDYQSSDGASMYEYDSEY